MKNTMEHPQMRKEAEGFAVDMVHDLRKTKIVIPILLSGLTIAALIVFFTSVLPLLKTGPVIGQTAGEVSGTLIGSAVGSVEGATLGKKEGTEAGKNAGLSAEDTHVEIANVIRTNVQGLGKLEVLVGNVDLTTKNEVGDKYAALWLMRGNVVFTIDLNQVEITDLNGVISIVLPQPEAELKINYSETETVADWQRTFFNGTDYEGFEAYLRTIRVQKRKASEDIENYDWLLEKARDAAENQVRDIVTSVRLNNALNYEISFCGDEGK